MSRMFQSLLCGVVISTVGLPTESALAQARFGVAIGNGGGVRIGVGNGYYGPGYGPGYGYRGYGYGPVGVNIAPRPLYAPQPQPTYAPQAQPQTLMSPTLTADG